jgi:hypothetical protein
MKLLKMTLFFALIVASCSTSVSAQHSTASTAAVRSPEIVLKEFYKWYIDSIRHSRTHEPGSALLKKYVSLRFLRAIDRNDKLPPESDAFDADYFLLDQDTSGYTSKNIAVSKVVIKGTRATAVVTLPDVLMVSLVQEGGVWKIDKVKNDRGDGLVK